MIKPGTLLKCAAQILLVILLCMYGLPVSAQTAADPKAGSGYKILRSNVDSDFYFQAEINSKGILVKGKSTGAKNKWAWILIKNSSGGTAAEAFSQIKSDGSYQTNLPQSLNKDGTYSLDINLAPERYSQYNSAFYAIKLEVRKGDLNFAPSSIYASNSQQVKTAASVDPSAFLKSTADDNIKKKTLELISGITTPEQKVKVIHDWIAENIYYDWDAFRSGNIASALGNASSVFKSKRSVCEGYAELFLAMVREAGIPCRLVEGNAIWPTQGQTWENTDKTKVNHAWNEVYLGNRWVILDVTWDSGNKYENGIFTKGEKGYSYYDPTLEFFSFDHMIKPAPPQKPSAPTGFSGTIKGTVVTLNWNPVQGAESYKVYVYTSKLTYNAMVAKGTKFQINGLAKSTRYYFYVTAVNSSGEGTASKTITGTT